MFETAFVINEYTDEVKSVKWKSTKISQVVRGKNKWISFFLSSSPCNIESNIYSWGFKKVYLPWQSFSIHLIPCLFYCLLHPPPFVRVGSRRKEKNERRIKNDGADFARQKDYYQGREKNHSPWNPSSHSWGAPLMSNPPPFSYSLLPPFLE